MDYMLVCVFISFSHGQLISPGTVVIHSEVSVYLSARPHQMSSQIILWKLFICLSSPLILDYKVGEHYIFLQSVSNAQMWRA